MPSLRVALGSHWPLSLPVPGSFKKTSERLSIKRIRQWAWSKLSLLPLRRLAAQNPPALVAEDAIMEDGKEGEVKGTSRQLSPRFPCTCLHLQHL